MRKHESGEKWKGLNPIVPKKNKTKNEMTLEQKSLPNSLSDMGRMVLERVSKINPKIYETKSSTITMVTKRELIQFEIVA